MGIDLGRQAEPMLTDTVINAPRSLVWNALADLEGVSHWNPTVDAAECLSDQTEGIGARRRCYMHPSGWMTEVVTEWEPERVIAFTVENAPPLKTGMARFALSDDPRGTRLQASFEYEVRFGPLGPVIDRLIVHRQISAAWEDGMQNLRSHLEQSDNNRQATDLQEAGTELKETGATDE